MLAYIRSRVLSSLVGQLTYCLNVSRTVSMVTWLKSPDMMMTGVFSLKFGDGGVFLDLKLYFEVLN